MMMLRPLLVLGLVLTLSTSAADAAKGAKKKKAQVRHGVVESVSLDNDQGTLTIKVHAKKKKAKGEAAVAKESKSETFKLTGKTKVELVGGKKGSETSKLSELSNGKHVIVAAKDGVAEEIKIVAKKKAKKKKKNA